MGGGSPGGGNGSPLQYSCGEVPPTEEPGGLQSVGSQSRVTKQQTAAAPFLETVLLHLLSHQYAHWSNSISSSLPSTQTGRAWPQGQGPNSLRLGDAGFCLSNTLTRLPGWGSPSQVTPWATRGPGDETEQRETPALPWGRGERSGTEISSQPRVQWGQREPRPPGVSLPRGEHKAGVQTGLSMSRGTETTSSTPRARLVPGIGREDSKQNFPGQPMLCLSFSSGGRNTLTLFCVLHSLTFKIRMGFSRNT